MEFDDSLSNVDTIINKVVATGFNAELKHSQSSKKANNYTLNAESKNYNKANIKTDGKKNYTPSKSSDVKDIKRRLIISILFTLPLFYISMGEMMKFPLPSFFTTTENSMIFAITLLLLTLPVMFANIKYFKVGFKNLISRSPNMDSLIAIGSGAAFLFGISKACR